jgi:diguanylate cyclase (GGDEF)-like protein
MKQTLLLSKRSEEQDRCMNIKTKLIIALITLLLLPGTVLGISSFYSAKTHLEQLMVDATSQEVKLIDKYITETLSGYIRLANSIYPSIENNFEKRDLPDMIADFIHVVNSNEEIMAMYIATETGEFIDYPNAILPPNYDARKREWYMKAKANHGIPVISNPYIDPSTNQAIVTISKELKNREGVLSIDISLAYLHKIILDLKIGKEGYPVLLDEDKKIVVHPTFAFGKTLPDYITSKLKESLTPYKIEFDSTTFVTMTNQLTGWTVAGNIDQDEMTKRNVPILLQTGKFILLFFLIGGIVTYYILRMITIPTNRLLRGFEQVINGELTTQVPVTSNDEFGRLSKSFNQMTYSLQDTVEKLNESKITEFQTKKMAYFDTLTGLPNRREMEKRISEAILAADVHSTFFYVIFMDIDGFKQVNDQYGHEIGDKLLIEVSMCLKNCIRRNEFVSRWAGDEFVVLIQQANNRTELEEFITCISQSVRGIMSIDGCKIGITVSLGIAEYKHDGISLSTLLKQADQAMYKSKQAGKNRYYFYEENK